MSGAIDCIGTARRGKLATWTDGVGHMAAALDALDATVGSEEERALLRELVQNRGQEHLVAG